MGDNSVVHQLITSLSDDYPPESLKRFHSYTVHTRKLKLKAPPPEYIRSPNNVKWEFDNIVDFFKGVKLPQGCPVVNRAIPASLR